MDGPAPSHSVFLTRRRLLRGLAGLGGLALLPVLGACGAAAPTATSAPAGGSSATTPTAPAASGGKPASLTFWVIGSFTATPDAPIFKAAQQYAAQHPGVQVKVESASPTTFRDKLVTAVKGGQGPDIASVDSAWVAGLAAANVLTPLDDRFAAVADQFFPGPAQTGAYLGKQYAVPWYTNNVALFWNKGAFKAAGLNAPPTDWQELVDFGKKLTAGDKYGLMLGAKGFGAFLWFPFAWQNGTALLSADGKQAEFGGPAGQQAWQFYADLYLADKIVPDAIKGATDSWDQLFAPFIQGKAAMMLTGDWGIQPVQKGNPNLDFGIAPLPKGKEAATVIGGYDLTIPATSKNAAAAWDFIEWFTSKDQEGVLQAYQRIQARKDIVDSAYAKQDPLIEVFVDQSAVGRARATVPQWDEIENTILADAWDSVILGQAKPADALNKAVQQTNDLLKQ